MTTMPIDGWWIMSNADLDELIHCPSFDNAMDVYFEGYNPPRLAMDGVLEDFSVSHARVEAYYKNKHLTLKDFGLCPR